MAKRTERAEYAERFAHEAKLKRFGHLSGGQMLCLVEIVFDCVVEYYASNLDGFELEYLLDDAADYIEELRGELNPLNTTPRHPKPFWKSCPNPWYRDRLFEHEREVNGKAKNPEEWLWRDIKWNLDDVFDKGTQSSLYWYIGDLGNMCDKYLKRPWIHCKMIDLLLIRAMIYQAVLDVGEAIKPIFLGQKKEGILKLYYPPIKGTYSEALNSLMLRRSAWSTAWMIIAGLVGFGFAMSNGPAAGVLAGFAFWMLARIREALMNYEERNENVRLMQALLSTKKAYALMDRYPLSPYYLREQLAAAVDKGAPLPVGIFAILDNVIAKDPLLWTTAQHLLNEH